MAKRQQARRMASQGASAANIQQRTGVSRQAANRMTSRAAGGGASAAAPATIQQPKPNISIPGQWRYIPNLNAPGTNEYNRWSEKLGPGYDGGGWVGQMPNAPGNPTDDDMRAFAKAQSMPGGALGLGSWDAIRSKAAEWDQLQANNSSSSSASQGTSPSRANLGTGNRISRGRIQSIMDQKGIKGRNADRARMRITNRLVQKGGTLGIGAAKDYAKAYAARNPQEAMMMDAYGKDYRVGSSGMTGTYEMPKNDMSSRKGQRGALFRGIQGVLDSKDYAKGDVLASLRSGDVRAQPFGTGAGGMGAGGGRGKGKGKGKRGRGRGGNGGDMGYDTGYGMDQTQPMDMAPMAPAQMEEESSKITMPSISELIGNWATGFKTKRSSRRRAGPRAQGLSSQTVAPTGNWRYGT